MAPRSNYRVVLTAHAVQRAVERLIPVYQQEALPGEDIEAWLRRTFGALVRAIRPEESRDHHEITTGGVQWRFRCEWSGDLISATLITVTARRGDGWRGESARSAFKGKERKIRTTKRAKGNSVPLRPGERVRAKKRELRGDVGERPRRRMSADDWERELDEP